jgi:hypothetical protein
MTCLIRFTTSVSGACCRGLHRTLEVMMWPFVSASHVALQSGLLWTHTLRMNGTCPVHLTSCHRCRVFLRMESRCQERSMKRNTTVEKHLQMHLVVLVYVYHVSGKQGLLW